jgi:putative DNA primase/helicase
VPILSNYLHDIARIIDEAVPIAPAPTPHPPDAGAPPDWPGVDQGGSIPIDPPLDWQSIDRELLAICAEQPQNDTGNGQRLLKHFGNRILHVRELSDGKLAGWHMWTGTHWKREGGPEAAILYAQRTATRIALEADHIAPLPHESSAIEAASDAQITLDRLKAANKKKTDVTKKEIARLERIIDFGAEARDEVQKRRNRRRNFAISSGNGARLREMLNQAAPHRTMTQDKFNGDPLAFNVANGTLRFDRHEVLDLESEPGAERYTSFFYARLDRHSPDDLNSLIAPIEYDPRAQCPKFLASLERFQPSASVRHFLQKYYGYALTGLNGEQCLVFNGGGGSNWKSTFTEIICRVMGDYAGMLKFESIAGEGSSTGAQASPDIARLPGTRLVRASEPDRGVPLKEGLIKSVTGGEPILTRHIYGSFFQFYPVFKLSLSGNHKPEISGVDHGIWRRIRYVIWPVKIEDSEKREMNEVLAELWEERAGILNWLVDGTLLYLTEGLRAPQEVIEATNDYREEMDPIGGFVSKCVTVIKPEINTKTPPFVGAQAMFEAFEAWCLNNGVRPWKQKAFGSALSQKGFIKDRTSTQRGYIWVELHDVPTRPSRRDDAPHLADDEIPV